ncbi:MAG: outer membrane lipoprotein-sorting protein [Verrucomicrobiaceae bacterium]|nr:MAG: outer membrane lipoprotein-sorting protein [Verrucomicrobiaceae bacterium]
MNFKIALASTFALVAPAAFAQNAQQILEGARVSATLTQVEDGLTGKLNGKTPIVLFLRGKDIQFQFNEGGGWEKFHMRLTDNSYDLFELKDDKTFKFPDAKITQSIAGTDLTYEDLALRFFYWPNPILEGQEQIGGRAAYKLRVNKPNGTAGRYDTVYIWVDAKFGAFMQIRGYNSSKLLKEFKVEDVMEIGGGVWTLKKMQVSTYEGDAGKERRKSVTSVTFDTPKKAGPKGLRK